MGKPLAPPLIFLSPPPPTPQTSGFNLDSKISPSLLLIIIILAIIFFVSGLLHLLVRCLLRPAQRDPDDYLENDVTALQGQLQQLFHLHDAGVDQSYIDTLPVFPYKAIIGVKDPFDCAVCLCEFEAEDKLRLLPKCSHAFHMDCIDTWLLSHSTCPLCRSSLLGDMGNINFPIVCVLESGSVENSREIRESDSHMGTGMGFPRDQDGSVSGRKSCESTHGKEDVGAERIVTIKLGKFKNVDGGEGCSVVNDQDGTIKSSDINNNEGNNNLGSRRCYSMGSFAYVLDEALSLQVPIRTPAKKPSSSKKLGLPLKPGYRAAMSEYGSDSMREFNGIEAFRSIEFHKGNAKLHTHVENGNGNGDGDNVHEKSKRRDSFSISKIWARGRKGNESSRRTNSGIEIDESVLGGGDDETQSCYSVDSLVNPTSSTSTSTKRTLLWLMGRHNKIAHNHSSSISSNV